MELLQVRTAWKQLYFKCKNYVNHFISNEIRDTVFYMKIVSMLYVFMLLCVSLLGVIMVYFSGYLIEATGSWASVFGLITVVNLLGLATFLSFAEARRVDIDLAKGRYHNIHIWEHGGWEQSNTIRIWSLWICCVLCMRGGRGHREITDSKKTVAGFFTMALQKSVWLKKIKEKL